ncbi:S8 family serine peptidase [Haloechinothrix salitolerans]|uniref:S8 family serine peptidase n=1 Tax=Haloechinothrix salitolerans TaxID=926830 RepID=A0ABW2BUL3_9PSEU
MSQRGRLARIASIAFVVLMFFGPASAAANPLGGLADTAPIDPWLASKLDAVSATEDLTVLIHGTSLAAARSGAERAGLERLGDLERIGVTIARGTPPQVTLAARQAGVSYVEGNQPIELFTTSSHDATRGSEVLTDSFARSGTRLDGSGVSVAVIDTGVDPTHPFFQTENGDSIVVANLKYLCGVVRTNLDACFTDVGPLVDTDTLSAGGHGTHVNGIVAGQPTELAGGATASGAAPGARLVSLSMGAGLAIINANMALEWVLNNHEAPCGDGVSAAECPPIKVTNNSYGPASGGSFNPESATAKLQRELAAQGVVTVWANGNGGGDGSVNRANPPGQDPTPGIISAASYFDKDTGTRDGVLSGYSSRGDRTEPSTWPDISAPGENITSACRPQLAICSSGGAPQSGKNVKDVAAFNTISGTSMAAPHIAGIVAQLFQLDPSATPGDVEHALKSTAYRYEDGAPYRDVGDYRSSYDKGTGLADVVGAVEALGGHQAMAEAGSDSSSDTDSEPAATCGG